MAEPTTTPGLDIGTITIGRTVYQARALDVGPNAARAGVIAYYGLTGPHGATYFVTDHGPKYKPNSIACGGSDRQRWRPAPRPLRGLEYSHLIELHRRALIARGTFTTDTGGAQS